jgi:hypothetical protein
MGKKTLIIGASENPERYAFKAIQNLRNNNHPVVAISKKKGKVADVEFETTLPDLTDIDTVSLYIGPKHQAEYIDYVIGLKPNRVVFNPGTENDAFFEKLNQAGIPFEAACTLVLLSTGLY